MAQPEPIRTLDLPASTTGPAEIVLTTEKTQLTASKSGTERYIDPPAWFLEALEDAERLLKYAAESGISVDGDLRDQVLQARATSTAGWDENTAARVLTALSTLAARLKPVTAESLKAFTSGTRPTVRNYWTVAICLAIVIVPFSLASFLSSAISAKVRDDITSANDLAVKLRAQLGSPGDHKAVDPNDANIISELQQYAADIRSIDQRGRQLNALVLYAENDPYADIRDIRKDGNKKAMHDTFQLPSALDDFATATTQRTDVYQNVRYFAQSALDDVSFFYGAVTACLLPVLYALLGTCAYLLRTFEQQTATRTFIPTVANSARFLIAAIGGAVCGLFGNFTFGQAASIPPLAIAFLVGYAVDVFFVFLEGMLQPFTTRNANSASPPSPAGGKA